MFSLCLFSLNLPRQEAPYSAAQPGFLTQKEQDSTLQGIKQQQHLL
jgi:hypothetical protein